MKLKRTLCTLLSAIVCALCLCSCFAKDHQHTWKTYIAKQPTCTEKGILERVCEECSKQEFEEIAPTGHHFVEGVCTVCGNTEKTYENTVTLDTKNVGYTLDELYDIAQKNFGYKQDKLFFLARMQEGYVEKIYADNLNLVHFDVVRSESGKTKEECTLAFDIDRETAEAPFPDLLKIVYRVTYENSSITLLYTDGTKFISGSFDSVFLNEKNQVAIVKDKTALFVGKISKGEKTENNSQLIYEAKGNGYAVVGVVGQNIETIEIPLTFHGKPVIAIDDYAFSGLDYLQSLIIGENIETVGHWVVYLCSSLEYVIVPTSLSTIGAKAFCGVSDFNVFFKGNQKIYSLSNSWKSDNVTAYFKNEWHWDANGKPVANR